MSNAMRSFVKKLGRRVARTWGRVHGPSRGNTKRVAAKGTRKFFKRRDV